MPGFSENGHEGRLGLREGEAFTMVSLWASDAFKLFLKSRQKRTVKRVKLTVSGLLAS